MSFKKKSTAQYLNEKYTYPESQFIETPDATVHYRKTGKGPALLLLHGLNSSLHTWEQWQAQLSNEFTVISLDLPVFGLTGGFTNDDYSMPHYLLLLEQCLDALNIDCCHIAGNSFGGLLAWKFALHFPSRVEKLVVLDATAYPRKRLPFNYYLAMWPATRWLTYILTPKFLVRKTLKKAYADESKVDAVLDRYHELLQNQSSRRNFSKLLRTFYNPMPDYSAQVTKISQPTLIMWGEDDTTIEVAHAHLFHRDIAHAELKIYANTGHMPMEERPMETVTDVRNFLQST